MAVIEAFPGQGIQEGGIGRAEGIDREILWEVCKEMAGAIDYKVNLWWLVNDATTEQINSSQEYIQLAIIVMERVAQLSMLRALMEEHDMTEEEAQPDIVIGHSVGEIAALLRAQAVATEKSKLDKGTKTVINNVINNKYAALLGYERAYLMGEAGKRAEADGKPGSAIALVGPTGDRILKMFRETGCPDLRIAAYNLPTVHTVSGPIDQLKVLIKHAKDEITNEPEFLSNVAVHNELFVGSVTPDLAVAMRRMAEEDAKNNGFGEPEPNSLVLNGQFRNSAREALHAITDGVSQPVMFDDGSTVAVDRAKAISKEGDSVIIAEMNPSKRPGLAPMIAMKYGRDKQVVNVSFRAVAIAGLKDVPRLKAVQKELRKAA